MLFNKNIDKETVKILLQENKRLKRSNQQLNESLNKLQWYKNEYKSLIEEVNHVKESYVKKMDEFETISNIYKSELDRLTKIRKNGR